MEATIPFNTKWVAEQRDRVTFSVQAFSLPEDPDPGQCVVQAGLAAEQAGLDAFFIGDHPGYATEPWLHLATIAARTSRIRLGSIVHCVAYRHPVMLARLAADFDQLSNGRLVIGLGIGWNVDEFAQLGIPFGAVPERQQMLDETVQILHGVWSEQPFTFNGKHFQTENGWIRPLPVQQPRPPLVIAGGGEHVTLRQVARYADACNFGAGRNTGGVRDNSGYARKFAVLKAHCDAIGRPFDDILRTHFTSWLMLAPTEKEAAAKLKRYYPDGMTEEQQITRVAGTPEQVIAYYQAIANAGMQYFIPQVLDAADLETIALLGKEVAPFVTPGPSPV